MNPSNSNEKDIELKNRMMRLLWHNGYFVRNNIDLVRFEFGKRTGEQFTDLDVLGVRFDFDLQIEKAMSYCTTSKTEKTRELLFWLNGVKNFFGANKAYFVRTEMLESKYIDAALKLGISPISSDHLAILEDAYNIDKNLFIGPFNDERYKGEYEAFKSLKEINPRVFYYLKVDYWADSPHRQIISLFDSLDIIKKDNKLQGKEKAFLKTYCVGLLSLAILDFSKPILLIKKDGREHQIKERLLGGDLSYTKREQISSFYDFMSGEIYKKYGKKYDVPRKEFIDQFYPLYTKYVVDIVERVCNSPATAVGIPNLIDIITYEYVLLDNTVRTAHIQTFYHKPDIDLLFKLTKDFLLFVQRSEVISEEDVNKILEGVKL